MRNNHRQGVMRKPLRNYFTSRSVFMLSLLSVAGVLRIATVFHIVEINHLYLTQMVHL